jgi:electron transfer flavoprotein alpha subunit
MVAIWVFAEFTSEGPRATTLELLTKARDLGDAAAVALGPGATDAAAALGEHGASTVYASDDEAYANGLGRPQVHALETLVREHGPEAILFSTSYDARDVAGRLQARLGCTLLGNATDVAGPGSAQTQIFGGSRIVDVALGARSRGSSSAGRSRSRRSHRAAPRPSSRWRS